MKYTVLAALLAAGSLFAQDYKVELDAVPGKEQVFFLDLAQLKADSSTFTLTTADGKAVPFSFDMRLLRPLKKNEVRKIDGFFSWSSAPASENRFIVPGWLSFKSVDGAKKYIFSFKDGAAETLARPNPAVRAWWIELMADPDLTDPGMVYKEKDNFTKIPGKGYKLHKLLRFRNKAINITEQAVGRSLLALIRVKSEPAKHNVSVQMRSAVNPKHPVVNPYYQLTDTKLTDVCVEGKVNTDPAQLRRDKGYPIWVSPKIGSNFELHRFNIQLPPSGNEPVVVMTSDIVNQGEKINLKVNGISKENIIAFQSGKVKGFKICSLSGKPEILYTICDKSGKTLRSGKNVVETNALAAGKYTLKTTLVIDGMNIRKQTIPFNIQDNPFAE